MHRVPLLAVVLVLLLAGCTSTNPDRPAPATPPPTEAAAVDKPNVVLITADDQSAMEMEWLPKTRRLLGEAGVTFPQMLAPHPNCCPARAQILTGQYAHNNGVATNSPPNGGFANLESSTALPVWLQEAGYRTGFTGKYLHGFDGSTGVEPGWDSFRPIVTQPLSRYYGPLQFDHGELKQWPRSTFHTDLVADQSADFIRDQANSDEPFFLWSSYIAPHGSCETSEEKVCNGPPPSAPEYADAFGDVELPSLRSPSFNEEDLSDKPRHRRNVDPVDPAAQQELFTARLRSLASLDDAVAQTIRTLDEAGELDNTVVLFTSDNGYMFGEHRLKGKVMAYEESVRVPLLMRGPGVPADQTRHQTVTMIDLAPTLAEITGATPQVSVDGQSLWGHATHDVPQGDRVVLIQAGTAHDDPDKRWAFRAVRTERYTLVLWRGGGEELYDRAIDPAQIDSRHRDEAYLEVRARLTNLLRRLESCRGEGCRIELPRGAGLE